MGKIHPLTIGEIFGRRVREERLRQGLTQDDVVDRLAKLGRPMDRSNLGYIERGKTTGQLDNLVSLALALGVSPIHLMLPQGGEEEVELAPKRRLPAADALLWIRGSKMLPESDPAAYVAAMSAEEQEAVALQLGGVSALARALMPPEARREAAERLREVVADVLAEASSSRRSRSRRRSTKEGQHG